MMGRIITARITPEAAKPSPVGLVSAKKPVQPRYPLKSGLTYWRKIGTRTYIAHSP